jgi:hypothetical protein
MEQETWVTIKTGDFAGQSGKACRQRGTALYVDIPCIGYVLCRIADVEFRTQRSSVRTEVKA